MKIWHYILPLFIISCNSKQEKSDNNNQLNIATNQENQKKEICWSGTLNNKVPVFIHYQIDNDLVIGTITYLNTKDKLPIKLIGNINEDKSYRLLEFDKTGNITGVIVGTPAGPSFKGSWFSPKTRKELTMELSEKDTVINSTSFIADENNIWGNYHYQYSEEGYWGDFNIEKTSNNYGAFSIASVTGAPARNIADVGDTVNIPGTKFIYKIPDTDSCEFEIKFYKGFVTVNYTKGYCDGQFGWNATVEGIFLKVD